jgi:hypothetical protein
VYAVDLLTNTLGHARIQADFHRNPFHVTPNLNRVEHETGAGKAEDKGPLSEVWKSHAGQIPERKNEQEETLLQLLKISDLQRLQAYT